jgi:hypothetical protein
MAAHSSPLALQDCVRSPYQPRRGVWGCGYEVGASGADTWTDPPFVEGKNADPSYICWLSSSDFPLIDTIRLLHGRLCALAFRTFDEESAQITVVCSRSIAAI